MPLRKYRYKRNGQEFGPLDESVMRTLVASGELGPDDQVRPENSQEWVVASELFVFTKKKTTCQVPPQLAHPPSKFELSKPWIFALIFVLLICAVILIWSVHQESAEAVHQILPSTFTASTAKKKINTVVDKSIEDMNQRVVPANYDELIAALDSPPAPPEQFDDPAELVCWWTAYSQLYEKYWNVLTQIQQQRVSEEILAKWRAPWKSVKLFVKRAGGEVREVKSTAKISDIPSGYFVAELQQGALLNCVLYKNEEEVARINKGSDLQASDLRVIKISDGDLSHLFPEQRHLTIWYMRQGEE